MTYCESDHSVDLIEISSSFVFNPSTLLEIFIDFMVSTRFSVCFSQAFPKREYVNLASSIIWFRLEVVFLHS